MKIVELPKALGLPGQLSLAVLLARPNVLTTGATLYLGNGVTPHAELTGARLTAPADYVYATALRIRGVWLGPFEMTLGEEGFVAELFPLAAAAGLTLQAGDCVDFYTPADPGEQYPLAPFTVILTFADATTRVLEIGPVNWPAAPFFHQMGGFRLGWPAGAHATSYQRLVSQDGFAHVGALLEPYSASAPTIDEELGLLVQLSGVDQALDEATAFNAFANDLLVFIGDEIMSVAGTQLVAPGTYRIRVVRARCGTAKGDHAAGADVGLIAREDLLPVAHPQFRIGNEISLKVALLGGGSSGDAAAVEAQAYTVTGRGFLPAPANLRINGALSGAAGGLGDALLIEWDLPDGLDFSGEGGWRFSSLVEVIGLYSEAVRIAAFDSRANRLSLPPGALVDYDVDYRVQVSLRAESDEQILFSNPIELAVQTL